MGGFQKALELSENSEIDGIDTFGTLKTGGAEKKKGTEKDEKSDSWIEKNWWIIVIAVVAAVAGLAILAFVVTKKKQEAKDKDSIQRYGEVSTVGEAGVA